MSDKRWPFFFTHAQEKKRIERDDSEEDEVEAVALDPVEPVPEVETAEIVIKPPGKNGGSVHLKVVQVEPREWQAAEQTGEQIRKLPLRPDEVETLRAFSDLRPRYREECAPGGSKRFWGEGESCPWFSCRHHLGIEVSQSTGSIKLLKGYDDGRGSCSRDIAEQGEHTLEEVGELMGFSRERARQVEEMGKVRLKKHGQLK